MRNPKYIIINGKQLSEILEAHRKWVLGDDGGERADLSAANLSAANLRAADLSAANLSAANLRAADLSAANLRDADLRAADLSDANLRAANLRAADLSAANLSAANLRAADLSAANLSDADLSDADLRAADLSDANLRAAKNKEMAEAVTCIIPDGDIIGWKKCKDDVIVKLSIPSTAKRSNATDRKCRAEYATVIEVFGAEYGVTTNHGPRTEYHVGEIVRPDKWDANRWEECSNGIHFFITRWEAEHY
jgi:hypothetical protein